MTMAGVTAADVVRGLPEVEALALTIWGESRAETPDGQIAVGQVILHRLRSGKWGHTVNEVVCAKSQFSCLWPFGGRDNHERVKATADALARGDAVASESFRQCRWIAQGLLDGMVIRDLVKGAMNYLTTDLLGSGLAPKWATTMDVTAKIGHHVFGRAALVLCAALLAATAASAQVVINPTTVEFTPSVDHARTFEGVALVDSYRLDIYLVGATAPATSATLGKPTPGTDGKIRVQPSALAAIPVATKYEARVVAVGAAGEGASTPSNPFGRLGPPAAATAVAIAR